MSYLNLVLLILVVGCAVSVVNFTNHERELFIALGHAQSEERQLAQEWSELQYRQSALSKTTLIEKFARDRLKMQAVAPDRIQYWPTTVPADVDGIEFSGGMLVDKAPSLIPAQEAPDIPMRARLKALLQWLGVRR
jgi:cell division protein FtsL